MDWLAFSLSLLASASLAGAAYFRGYRRGVRAGVKGASEAIMTKVTDPSTMAQMIVHTETCTDCGPKVKAEMVKVRAMGVPADHPDRLTGQYL